MNKIYLAFFMAVSITFIMTPLVMILAEKVGAIDVPKDNRRVHKTPIPRLGGLAIYIGFMSAVLFTLPLTSKLIGVLIGATIIVAMGFVDDIKPLPAKLKFLIQMIAAIVVIYAGVRINGFTNPLHYIFHDFKGYINLGMWSYPVTLLWIVGVTNSINLIDGLDGLAAGLSVIASLTLFAVALGSPSQSMIIIALTAVLAGSAIGFLPYNFNPAKIFMGDTGSLFLGYMLAVISIMGVLKSYAALSILVPIFAMGLPIFDTLFAMLRRAIKGKSMMEADKGHLHHRLLDIGFSQKQAVLTLYIISAFLGFSAVALIEASLKTALIVIAVVFLFSSFGVKYLGLIGTDSSENNIDV